MSRDLLRSSAITLLAVLLVFPATAQQQLGPPKASPDPQDPVLIPYIPPPTEKPAPRVRSAGATRGLELPGHALPKITLLVPEHVALTLEAQPSLYWYISAPSPVRIEVTLIDGDSVKPLLERGIPSPVSAGIQAVRLADYDVKLEAGKTYEWSVTLVAQAERSAADQIARGFIRRAELSGAPATNDPSARARWLAGNGIWYDALTALTEASGTGERADELSRQLDGLLAQAGLENVIKGRSRQVRP